MDADVAIEKNWARRLLTTVVVVVTVTASGCGGTSAPSQQASPSASSSAESVNELNADIAKRLDAAIKQAMTEASVPGAIVGVWGPDGRYVRAFGVADKATGAAMETDFYSRIGSVTKTFTVTSVLQLADQGKLGLDDPIGKYVDGVPQGDQITLRELARMQSGLPNYTNSPQFQQAMFADPRRNFSPQELLGFAYGEPSKFAPGQGFEYSNTNTILLGLVVERVGGQPLPAYIRDRILTPLGMSHTSFPDSNEFPEPHAQGYTDQTADGSQTTATDWNPSWAWAAGAMISTLEDMHTWAPSLADGNLLSPQMQAQRLQTVTAPGVPEQDRYGLGIFNRSGWIGHNGSLPGYQAVVVHRPEAGQTVVILINTDVEHEGAEPSTTLATAVTKVISPAHVY